MAFGHRLDRAVAWACMGLASLGGTACGPLGTALDIIGVREAVLESRAEEEDWRWATRSATAVDSASKPA